MSRKASLISILMFVVGFVVARATTPAIAHASEYKKSAAGLTDQVATMQEALNSISNQVAANSNRIDAATKTANEVSKATTTVRQSLKSIRETAQSASALSAINQDVIKKECIKSLQIGYDKHHSSIAIRNAVANGHTRLKYDLNAGAGGATIYLSYKR